MNEKLRFTGEYPPLRYWEQFPNWQFALEEEDVEGQDETTLRPADVQEFVNDDVSHTVGEIRLANGSRLPALLGTFSKEVGEIYGFLADNSAWLIRSASRESAWKPFVEDWLPEAERSPSVALDDLNMFPIEVMSRLPFGEGGKQFHVRIDSQGQMLDL